jgi:hypothetical protein
MIKYKLYEAGNAVGIQDRETGNSFVEGKSSQWQQYQIWLSEGNTPIPLPPSEYYDLVDDGWVYDIDRNKTDLLNQINQEVNTYINNYYDIGTQQSFTGIYTKRSTPDAARDYLDPVWTWIEAVMSYYYTKKQSIIDASSISALGDITWDFTTFDATKPDVSLQALMVILSA